MPRSFPLKFLKLIFSVIFIFALPLAAWSKLVQEADSVSNSLTHEDLVRGERLFHGLVYLENKSTKCSGCHNTAYSDTLNWNPDAIEISRKYHDRTNEDLVKVLLKPAGKKLAESHSGITLTPDEIRLIKGYMDELPEKGLKKAKPDITNLILFIIASILFLLSITDLIITKKLRRKQIHYFILTVTSVFITYILVKDAIALGRSPGYSPDQPVKFSHVVHAGQNQTDCIYCHSYAPYSKAAGIPAENVCMNCHLIVRNGTRSGTWEISKVTTAFENKVPIEWIRVHNLPDHVFFSHAQHVNAGKINCTECHGNVAGMDRIVQVNDLSMGWCINCHRRTKVNFSENEFYTQYVRLSEKMKNGVIDSVTVSDQGGTECMRCHY